MNKVTTVNLNGRAYQVEEQAYEALRAYLDEAARLLADDPDCREILADLEQAIGEKGSRYFGSGRNVLSEAQMARILAEMGPVETGAQATVPRRLPARTQALRPARRCRRAARDLGPEALYLVKEGEMIAGVCNGLAAYFGVDPTIVRLIFVVLLVLSSGLFAIAYLVLMFVVPTAKTAGGTRGGARPALQCARTRRAGQAPLRRDQGQPPALARQAAARQGASRSGVPRNSRATRGRSPALLSGRNPGTAPRLRLASYCR